MIPLRAHNILDYVIGAILMVSPWLFGFGDIAAARNTLMILGLGLITYSLLTNYYFSIARVIPLGLHMAFDAAAGAALILAPSLLQYRNQLTDGQHAVHFLLGLGAITLVAFTKPRTETAKSPRERAAIARDAPMPH